jgi:serine/threonine protein kinase
MIGKGQRIAGRYLLESEIGAGGMGVVWRARDERLGRDVAVKVLAANTVGNEVARARLVREARAAGRLQHEGIVHVYDVGETDDGGAFLVMELVAGHTLRTWMEDGKLSLNERVELLVAVGAALACAHEFGIVHRDIKPDNVLVRSNGRPVLLDFGLAKPTATRLVETADTNTDGIRLTGTGNIVGTPAYLSPEQVKGEDVGPAADQFSLAAMTFEVLTGRLPWKGMSVIEVLASMLHEQPLSAQELVPELPAGIDEVLLRAMSKEPQARFPSVVAFIEALRTLFPGVTGVHFPSLPPLSPRPRPSTHPAQSAAGSAETGLEKRVSSTSPRSMGTALRLGSIGVAVAALVAGVAIYWSSRSQAGGAGNTSVKAPALPADAVIACPLFNVEGELPDPSSGWLGAAAAALTCDRVQALRGGESSRTLAPAELVPGTPREPSEGAPSDPFSAAGLLERTLEAAKKRAPAYVAGTVTKTPLDFGVKLTLRLRDGHELGTWRGRGEELFEAVSAAVHQAQGVFGDGSASVFQKQWLRIETREAALDVLDVTTALLSETDLAAGRACERAQRQRGLLPEMAFLLRAICNERLKRTPLPEEPPRIDASSTGALVTTVAAQRTRGGPAETKQRVELLRKAEAAITNPDERAILLSTTAELLYNIGDLSGAQSAARIAGQLSPKLVDPRGTPWHRLTFSAEFDRAIGRVHASWIPWEPMAVVNTTSREADFATRTLSAARARLLCWHGYYAESYGELLAESGKTEAARTIADQLDDDYLRIRAFVGAAQYKRALELALGALAKLPADDASASKAFRLASVAAECSRYLGRPAAFMSDVVKRFLDPEPPHVRVGVMPFFALVYACVEAPEPIAKHCLTRLRRVYERGDMGGVVGTVPLVLEGADRWLAGDAHAAAMAWRPMLRQGGNMGEAPFRHILATVFDRAQMPELAARVDSRFMQLVDAPDAVDLAFARAAVRAERSGNVLEARKFAQACIERWQHADDDVPARKDMVALLKRIATR